MALLKSVRERLWVLRDELRWAADWDTLRALHRNSGGLNRLRIRLLGRQVDLWVRAGTLDTNIARQILREDSEYALPVEIDPRVILDIGANIGCTSVYFAVKYPNARIWSFEPLPENIDLLRKNVAQFDSRVTVVPTGLGRAAGVFRYHPSDDAKNLGGGGFLERGIDISRSIELPVTTLEMARQEYGIPQPDLIKVDTEGAEFSILEGTAAATLSNTKAIIGELHGVSDWETLTLLSGHYQIACSKRLNQRCFAFVGVNAKQL